MARTTIPVKARVITLLTDFGLRDAYVGAMKGVIASVAPQASVVDLCHEIPAADILQGGLVWAATTPYFPVGTIHVAVIDPGVGSRRRILAFESRNALFLAPDNGIIGYVLSRREVRKVVHVRRREHFLDTVSATFHGRDIFAPVAARLAAGLPPESLGPTVKEYRRESLPRPRRRRIKASGTQKLRERGEVIHIDSFGNAITNLRPSAGAALEELRVGDTRIPRMHATYSQVKVGSPLAVVGSTGCVEISVNQGDASSSLGIRVGDCVLARWKMG